MIRSEALRVLSDIETHGAPGHGRRDAAPVPGQSDRGGSDAPMSAKLAVELISPLVVANSSYSETLTQQRTRQGRRDVAP